MSESTDSPWSIRLRELRKECNFDEEHLFSGLVDPGMSYIEIINEAHLIPCIANT